jgi:hypothetical protein
MPATEAQIFDQSRQFPPLLVCIYQFYDNFNRIVVDSHRNLVTAWANKKAYSFHPTIVVVEQQLGQVRRPLLLILLPDKWQFSQMTAVPPNNPSLTAANLPQLAETNILRPANVAQTSSLYDEHNLQVTIQVIERLEGFHLLVIAISRLKTLRVCIVTVNYFLTYSPELNLIEIVCRFIKYS